MSGRRNEQPARFAEVQVGLRRAMKPIADIERNLRRAIGAVVDFQKRMEALRVPVLKPPELDAGLKRFIERQERLARAIEDLGMGPMAGVGRQIAELSRHSGTLDDAGWLPHYSTPFAMVEECEGDSVALHARLEAYYRGEWEAVRRDIETRFRGYGVDEEAKATFSEALAAHEGGFYRSVCRVLLPEIERVARRELHGDRVAARITSQPLLKELAGDLTPVSVEPKGLYALNLFRRLRDHLYERVQTEEARERFENDPVPNRHAAVHGLVAYASMQNSLNAIFMADYVFQVISFWKNASQ